MQRHLKKYWKSLIHKIINRFANALPKRNALGITTCSFLKGRSVKKVFFYSGNPIFGLTDLILGKFAFNALSIVEGLSCVEEKMLCIRLSDDCCDGYVYTHYHVCRFGY